MIFYLYEGVPDRPPKANLVNSAENSLKIEWGIPNSNGSPLLYYILEMEEGDIPGCDSKEVYRGILQSNPSTSSESN